MKFGQGCLPLALLCLRKTFKLVFPEASDSSEELSSKNEDMMIFTFSSFPSSLFPEWATFYEIKISPQKGNQELHEAVPGTKSRPAHPGTSASYDPTLPQLPKCPSSEAPFLTPFKGDEKSPGHQAPSQPSPTAVCQMAYS